MQHPGIGLNDAYFSCGTGTSCFWNVRVSCTSNYASTSDISCAVIADPTYSDTVYDTITSVDWVCDNGSTFDNSTDYCEDLCVGCDDFWYLLTNSNITFVAWIQDNNNTLYVMILFFGSICICCVLLYHTQYHLRIDYKAWKKKRKLKKQIKAELELRNGSA